ncbi:hypothetical protein QBC40DRAFT_5443 [Triangularia verruculosa]|uniref:Uncharacterized protein n=1 Tax=Triangularia verruculosa TaxID=2587418 RepID=A0AAN7ASD8_9PEZI|nr:hypothetical protein QBC40DRAFT_5443 [Triangularia verruculosa]
MDAANLAEKKELKQAFVLATLISTIAGTFITGINLYDRLVEQRHQRKRDKGQNKRIKELETRLNTAEGERAKLKEEQEKRKRRQRGEDTDDGDDNDDDDGDDDDHGGQRKANDRHLRRSLQHGGPSIQREYDRFYNTMGQRFAQGDLVAQTQLQSHIIVLQSTVIKLLEEALLTGQPPDLGRLYNTSEFAREGSIRALQDQYQRFLQSGPIPRRGPRPGAPIRRTSSTPSLRGDLANGGDRDYPPARKALPPPPAPSSVYHDENRSGINSKGPLFCPYAVDLQRGPSPRLLHTICPACGISLKGPPDERDGGQSSWRIEKEVVVRDRGRDRDWERRGRSSSRGSRYDDHDGKVETRSFILTPRFVAKCHRPDSEYACYLCFCHRDQDTLCRTEEALISHVAGKHGISEYKQDRDMKEMALTLPHR